MGFLQANPGPPAEEVATSSNWHCTCKIGHGCLAQRHRAGDRIARSTLRETFVPVRAIPCVVLVLGVVLLLAAPASAQREHFELKLGPTYEQGTYGNPELTRIGFLPLTLKYLGERFDIAVTPSFLVIDTPDDIVVIDGRVAAAQTQGAGRRTEYG